ncbi:putative anthranilate synthase [Helianthus annuus]|nr:putative anthranilate synthase [Helianthus annuus]
MCPTLVGSDGYPFQEKFIFGLNLEKMLLSDEKQCAEHIMLVDLGRNDVGKVTKPGSVNVEKHMTVERYSHVMHISSTLLDNLTCWDTLSVALPVGIVSGAPKVKIVKLWRRPMKDNKKETWSIEMILMDEQGTKVTASCLQKFFPRFGKHLIQDDCLFIHRPSLAENKFTLKFAEKEQKVTFFYNTLITKCNSWSGSEHGFVFADFKSILDKSGSNDNSIPLGSILDLIGYVVICYPMEPTTTKLGLGKRMTLKLRDLNNEDLTVTLWDEFAEEMNAYMSWKDKDMHVVLLIQFRV